MIDLKINNGVELEVTALDRVEVGHIVTFVDEETVKLASASYDKNKNKLAIAISSAKVGEKLKVIGL